MLTIRDLIEQFEIQGAYKIMSYSEETDDLTIVAEGYDIRPFKIEDKYLDVEIAYMYADDNVLVIEVSND
jgi:hypothetical protein